MRFSLTQRPCFHPPLLHSSQHIREAKRVVVLGGGIAGVAAATILSERGVHVTVVEKEDVLGGRASAWTERFSGGDTFQMERGFHGFFRQYYNLRALLRRMDPTLSFLTELSDYPLLGPNGLRESFADLPKTSPFNLISLALRTSTLNLRDLRRTTPKPALAMMAFDMGRVYASLDTQSARDYLESLNFPKVAKQMLFDVFAHSFFNPEARLSAAELLMMFHFYFLGNPEGLVFDVMNAPFSLAWWQPWQRYLETKSVDFLLGCEAKTVSKRGEEFFVETSSGTLKADGVVLALNVPGVKALASSSPELGDETFQNQIAELEVTNPFAVYRAWLNSPTAPERVPFVGTTGLGITDNISLYHLFEDESRAWAKATGGSVVEVHAYAVDAELTEAAIRKEFLDCLHSLYPETAAAKIVHEKFLLRQDCPAFEPGSYANRPRVTTSDPGVVLAGDFVQMPFPTALMERAASSGISAANHLLHRFGVRGEGLWSVPMRGLLAPFGERLFR